MHTPWVVGIYQNLWLDLKKGLFIEGVEFAEHFESCPAGLESLVGFRHVASTDVKIAHQVGGQVDACYRREPVFKFLQSNFE